MKPLTIEELKALEVGDWVWVVDAERDERFYVRKEEECEIRFVGDNIDDEFAYTTTTADEFGAFDYSDYGTSWIAYKNKEQAEAKGEIVELPCKIDDTIWVVYRDCNNFDEYEIRETRCIGFAFENGTEIRILTLFNCYDYDRFGNFTDKAEAERRLAELKGEKI